jgi:hypothetical protein
MEKEIYDTIKSLLEERELYLDEHEIDTVIRIVNKTKVDAEHVGIDAERCEHNPREAAFQKHWMKQNEINPGVNSGHGILQGLFTKVENPFSLMSKTTVIQLNARDRQVAATAIQWLGSNCGFAFLQETLKDCGYNITPIK